TPPRVGARPTGKTACTPNSLFTRPRRCVRWDLRSFRKLRPCRGKSRAAKGGDWVNRGRVWKEEQNGRWGSAAKQRPHRPGKPGRPVCAPGSVVCSLNRRLIEVFHD